MKGTTEIQRRFVEGSPPPHHWMRKSVARQLPKPARDTAARREVESVLGEIANELFASLPRSDQRRRGLDYLRGLLYTPGRKSIRNMAARMGGSGTGQSLHHFICSSTWAWGPVRRALAEYLVRISPPEAWAVRPLLIPKTGQCSAGVGVHTIDGTDSTVNAQMAFGVWAVTQAGTNPVNWHLHVPEHGSRSDAATGGIDAALEVLTEWGLPARPVVFDAHGPFALDSLRRLRAAGLQIIARITPDTPLVTDDSALTGHVGHRLSAEEIMRAAKELRRPVRNRGRSLFHDREPTRHDTERPEVAASIRVCLPGPGGRNNGFALVGSGQPEQQWPQELWLTTLPHEHVSLAVPVGRSLLQTADRSQGTLGERVGLRDYAGRSFEGWHRHATLASGAHAVAGLSAHGAVAAPRWGALVGAR